MLPMQAMFWMALWGMWRNRRKYRHGFYRSISYPPNHQYPRRVSTARSRIRDHARKRRESRSVDGSTRRYRSENPFDLQGIADGARRLLAYGENVENINDDLIRLGNIAAGLSQPLGDIVYLYGTTMTQGRLYTQDLNQFTGRGIPMIRELAQILGVAENKVRELVEEGKVGFPEVQRSFRTSRTRAECSTTSWRSNPRLLQGKFQISKMPSRRCSIQLATNPRALSMIRWM